MFTYSYILSNFPNGKFCLDRLNQEIFNSSITIGLSYINGGDSGVSIYFKAELSDSEKAILDSIIANHSGEYLPDVSPVQQVKIAVEQPKYIDAGNVTQELFCAESIIIDVSSGDVLITKDFSWPFNVALKSGTLYITDNMIGDEINVKIAPNTIIGVLTSNLNAGDTSINVNSTVIQNIKYGQYIGLPNHELGRVTTVGSNYLTFTPASDVSANAGSYIAFSAKIIPYAYFSASGKIEIGKTVTTANRIPKNTIIRVEYKNNNATAKKVSFFVEYLY